MLYLIDFMGVKKMLKLLAMIFMLLDHFAIAFISVYSPFYIILRALGRLAMPIFAYKIALGFVHTSNFDRYLKRVIGMTLLAQIPFVWLISGKSFIEMFTLNNIVLFAVIWNVGLTFICSLLILRCIVKFKTSLKSALYGSILIPILLYVSQFGDYGLYGVGMVVIFYLFITYKKSYTLCAIGLLILTLAFIPTPLQMCSILGVLVIMKVKDSRLVYNKIWYLFYPLHMLVLVAFKNLLMLLN